MPDKSFKVNVYEVTLPDEDDDDMPDASGDIPFSDAIENAWDWTLPDRLENIGGKTRRLENYEKGDGYYLLNFVTHEFTGPGRSGLETEAVPMGLEENENFSHQTAMLYDPDLNLAFVESTQSGMRAGAIARYFREFSSPLTEYQLIPRLDDDAAARARRHQTIRSLTMRVAMGPVTDADRDAGTGAIKSFGEGFGAGSIDIVIKAQRERGRSLSLGRVWQTVNPILGDVDENNVTQLKVYGREHEDDGLELIDLIQHREKRERMLPVDDIERNVPYQYRWNALLEVRQEFLS